MNNYERKLETLNKIGLDVYDVMFLLDCKKAKAYEVMTICRDDFGGRTCLFANKISVKSLFAAIGLSLEDEIKKTKLLLNNENEKELH